MSANFNVKMNRVKYIHYLGKILTDEPQPVREIIIQIQELTQETDTLLDIGCGMKRIARHIVTKKTVGIDLFPEYLVAGDVHGDVRELGEIFPAKSFDIIVCVDIIEHIEKEAGEKLLLDMEKIARKYIVIVTPIEWTENRKSVENPRYWSFGNSLNIHKSLWSQEEMLAKGYLKTKKNIGRELFMVYKEIR